ncbi:NAD kinase [Chondrinema litorale]|uniref:NAD kinase n=1 Tax=Chondrinema litorale TaxID=2994555 RepID=UPI003D6DF220
MITIAVHSRTLEDDKFRIIKGIIDEIASYKVNLLLSKTLSKCFSKKKIELTEHKVFHNYSDLDNTDFIFSLGGDGTLLETITYVRDKNIPILGVNIGRLGFLATLSSNNIKLAMEAILNKSYTIDERMMLSVEADEDIFNGVNFGLNEFTILKRDSSSMIIVHTYLNGEYLNSYWSDGLIISTPTGSTGYSLSVGGPIVFPHSNSFIISPVSPHNLNVRPLILSDDSVLSFTIEGRSENFLVSLDSRSKKVNAEVKLTVKKCPFNAKLLKLGGENDGFPNTLRKKLNWGYDLRNRIP